MEEWEFHPLTADRWPDLEQLFGKGGAFYGCWCLWWRVKRVEFNAMKAAGRKGGLKKLAESGRPPGIVGYLNGRPVGWCSIGPREEYAALERSTKWKRLDQQPVWSVVCFYVAKGYRRTGATTRLLRAAVEYARQQGATIVEGYPVEPDSPDRSDADLYRGIALAFRAAGFVTAQEKPLIVRYWL